MTRKENEARERYERNLPKILLAEAELREAKLAERNRKLAEENEMSWGCLNEIRDTLSALDEKHPKSAESTPPMFYREWILCVVKQERDKREQLVAALRDLCREDEHFGGAPSSSPAWEHARALLARTERGEP